MPEVAPGTALLTDIDRFTVEDIDGTLTRLGKRGATLVGGVVQYEAKYRLCYIRGPEGILIGLAQQLGQQSSRANPT